MKLNLWINRTTGNEVLYTRLPNGRVIYVEPSNGEAWTEKHDAIPASLRDLLATQWNEWLHTQEVTA